MSLPAYPKYKPSGVEWLGDIPQHWDSLALRRRFRVVNGGTPSSAEEGFWDGEITWLAPDDLGKSDKKRIVNGRRQISKQGLENCGATLVPKSSLIVSTRAPIGYVAINDVVASTNQGCRALVSQDKKVSTDFFYYALIASTDVLQAVGKGTTFMELSAGALASHFVPIPSLTEQQAIADFLDAETANLDTLVAKKLELIEKLKEKRSALISRTVTRGLPPEAALAAGLNPDPKLKPAGIEWLGEIPEHWSFAQLRRFTSFITSGSRGWAEHYTDAGSIFVRIGNLTRDSINVDLADVQYVDPPAGAEGERTKIHAGDLLFSITAYLGSVAVATQQVVGGYINQHIALVRLTG